MKPFNTNNQFNRKYTGSNSYNRIIANYDIKATNILLIDEDWNKLWSYSKYDALKLWETEWKDVIQIWYNPQNNICTAKLMDLWKYKYELTKKNSEKKKVQKCPILKEIKFWYNIWDNDLNIKIKKVEDFLKEWDNVKIIWMMRWRENLYKEKLKLKIEDIIKKVETLCKPQMFKEEKNWISIILFCKGK